LPTGQPDAVKVNVPDPHLVSEVLGTNGEGIVSIIVAVTVALLLIHAPFSQAT
jgi:hypothetical protein